MPASSTRSSTKLRADGSGLLFSTYLGGGESEAASSVALDSAANVYITGTSGSLDFPVVDAIQPDLANVVDAIVAKLSANGSRLLYSTYLGGFMVDTGHAIAVDPAGSAYVTGLTRSEDFPVVNPLQSAPASEFEAFFAKITDFDLCSRTSVRATPCSSICPRAAISSPAAAARATNAHRARAYHTGRRLRAPARSRRVRAVQQPLERCIRHGIRPRRGVLHHRGR